MNLEAMFDKNGIQLIEGAHVKCILHIDCDNGTISGIIKKRESGKYYIDIDDAGGSWSLESPSIDWNTMEVMP